MLKRTHHEWDGQVARKDHYEMTNATNAELEPDIVYNGKILRLLPTREQQRESQQKRFV
jgi:hypothetical protein